MAATVRNVHRAHTAAAPRKCSAGNAFARKLFKNKKLKKKRAVTSACWREQWHSKRNFRELLWKCSVFSKMENFYGIIRTLSRKTQKRKKEVTSCITHSAMRFLFAIQSEWFVTEMYISFAQIFLVFLLQIYYFNYHFYVIFFLNIQHFLLKFELWKNTA